MNVSRFVGDAVQYLFVGIAAFLSVFPFAWMVISSTNTSIDILGGKATFGHAFATNVGNFFAQVDAPLVFWNSIKVSLMATAMTIVISSLAGYGFEMF